LTSVWLFCSKEGLLVHDRRQILSSGAGLGAQQHTICSPLKTRFKQKFIPKYMLKNAHFFEKNCKKSPQHRGILPRTSVGLRRLGVPPPDLALLLPPATTTFCGSFL